jgi:hypothetical protein
MDGERVYISHKDLWNASRESFLISSMALQDFEETCGIEFESSMWRQGTYVYWVKDAKKLMAACVRYGWRVTRMPSHAL